jgi:hypothetical protein
MKNENGDDAVCNTMMQVHILQAHELPETAPTVMSSLLASAAFQKMPDSLTA